MLDCILKGGTVIDGTGNKSYKSDVFIKDGIISDIRRIDDSSSVSAKEIIDVSVKITAPGFIDIHTRSDTASFSHEVCDSKIQQGITTEIVGNCGSSVLPFTENGLLRFYRENGITEDRI